MGLPNHFWTSWYHPTPESFRGSKLLKALPTVKGTLYCNCFKTNLLLVEWDPRYYGILHSPSPWHHSHFSLSLDWRVQAFSTISLSGIWTSPSLWLPISVLQFLHGLLRSRDNACMQYNTMLPGFRSSFLAPRTNGAVSTIFSFFLFFLESKRSLGLRSQVENKEY